MYLPQQALKRAVKAVRSTICRSQDLAEIGAQNWSDAETRFLLEARMKYLQDEYKRVKDHNSRSGNNRETFDYFYEINAVLGCKPNIAPKRVFECGFLEDASSSSMETGDSKDPPQSSDQGDQSSDVCYC